MESPQFPCFVCEKSFTAADSLVSHISLLHSTLTLQKFICKFDGCVRVFDRMKYFKKHLTSHKGVPVSVTSNENKKIRLENNKADVDSNERNESEDPVTETPCESDSSYVHQSAGDQFDPAVFFQAVNNNVLKILGELYRKDSLTRSHIQDVLECMIEIACGSYLDILEDCVIQALKLCNSDKISNVRCLFAIFRGMFDDVNTEHKRFNYFKKQDAYIEPEQYVTGVSNAQKNVKGQIILKPITLTGSFIPPSKILKKFLELPGVFQSIISYMDSLEKETAILENVIQGTLWRDKVKPLFEEKMVLPLNMSYDDFETNKDLGSHSTVHKLGACHITVSCLPPIYQSALENMFLVALFYTSDKYFGLPEVFGPVLDDLKKLEENGLELVIDDKKFTVYFALLLIIGDNLGVNTILGLVETFRANYFCSLCKMHREATETCTSERPDLLRTEQGYLHDLNRNDTSSTGIKGRCIWNDLRSYSIADNLCCDIMHDILEGVGDYDMALIIKIMVSRKYFNYDELNEYVQSFFYGEQEFGNKPPLITSEHVVNDESLKFSATEMLCLIRYFPLMVGHKVPENSEVWNFFLCLRELIDLLFSPKFAVCDLPRLEELITEHHEKYMRLSQRSLRPKYHKMIHYRRLIEKVGPLKPLWAMRWEGKYKEYRQAANSTSCRKKISQTLAIKQSLKVCTRILNKRGLVPRCEFSPLCVSVDVENLDDYENFEDRLPFKERGSKWNIVNWAKVNGTLYKPGMVVVSGLTEFFPSFGTIEVISVTPDHEVRFLTKDLVTVSFNSHLHSYHVKEEISWDCWNFINQKDLVTFCPAHKRLSYDGELYVMLRYPV
ncbi:Zinc finger protein 687 [Frankliniella fusca]|uniref:Zinc finger protein 687 n=1 Tax=Frankliniella fusca TaxID=407009 RepID=A0AAE1GWF6_9NEOP|nr:Zinc finger protein 687 [Frankliniella fusca]